MLANKSALSNMSSRRPNMSWTLTLELSVSIMWFYHVSNCELLTAPIFNSWYSKINQTLLSVIRWYFKYFDTAVHVWIIRPELSIDHRNLLSNNELMLRKEYSSSNSGPLPISSLSTLWGSGPGSEMDSKKNGGHEPEYQSFCFPPRYHVFVQTF